MTKTLVALSVTLLLGACSIAPDYQRPEVPQGASWQRTSPPRGVAPWQQQFLRSGTAKADRHRPGEQPGSAARGPQRRGL